MGTTSSNIPTWVATAVLTATLAACGGGTASDPILLSAETIRRRMPVPSEVSADWTDEGEPFVRDLERTEGPFVGVCGGPSFTGLAMDQGVQHVVKSANFWSPEGSYGSFLVMTFPSDAEATAMLASIPRECDLVTDSVPESIVQTVQMENDDDAGAWNVTESSTSFLPVESDADERIGLVYTTSIESIDACKEPDCGWDSTHVRIVDRYGNLVVITLLFGRENLRGFSNNEGATIPAATPAIAENVAGTYVPVLIENLRSQQGS